MIAIGERLVAFPGASAANRPATEAAMVRDAKALMTRIKQRSSRP
jgi:hypothetical protein